MDLQFLAERLLWISAVGTAAIVVVVSLAFALDICRDGLATAPAPDRRRLYRGEPE